MALKAITIQSRHQSESRLTRWVKAAFSCGYGGQDPDHVLVVRVTWALLLQAVRDLGDQAGGNFSQSRP